MDNERVVVFYPADISTITLVCDSCDDGNLELRIDELLDMDLASVRVSCSNCSIVWLNVRGIRQLVDALRYFYRQSGGAGIIICCLTSEPYATSLTIHRILAALTSFTRIRTVA